MKRKIQTGIYYIQNKKDKKRYIGSSNDIRKRFRQHRRRLKLNIHINNHLQRAYNKYGKEFFLFKILEIVAKSKLIKREQYWIDEYKSHKKSDGYNICPIANGSPTLNPEVAKRIGRANTGKKRTAKTKRKLSIAAKGNTNCLGNVHSEETRRKIGRGHRGKVVSEESKKRMSISGKKAWAKKRSVGMSGRKHSEESKRKMSINSKKKGE